MATSRKRGGMMFNRIKCPYCGLEIDRNFIEKGSIPTGWKLYIQKGETQPYDIMKEYIKCPNCLNDIYTGQEREL